MTLKLNNQSSSLGYAPQIVLMSSLKSQSNSSMVFMIKNMCLLVDVIDTKSDQKLRNNWSLSLQNISSYSWRKEKTRATVPLNDVCLYLGDHSILSTWLHLTREQYKEQLSIALVHVQMLRSLGNERCEECWYKDPHSSKETRPRRIIRFWSGWFFYIFSLVATSIIFISTWSCIAIL